MLHRVSQRYEKELFWNYVKNDPTYPWAKSNPSDSAKEQMMNLKWLMKLIIQMIHQLLCWEWKEGYEFDYLLAHLKS